MKYLVVLGDGMADYKLEELGNLTPLEKAKKPTIDFLAKHGELGQVKTVADGLKPGSDVANLSVMGYNPYDVYTGRSPLEAASIGVDMAETDVSFRCNLVCLSEDMPYENKSMVDYSSDEISTAEAKILIEYINGKLRTEEIEFFPGISYRHLLLWHNGGDQYRLTPPHDISSRKITEYLPDHPIILEMMKKSYELLKDHPVNKDRIKRGLHPANSIWIWGEGKKPLLYDFEKEFHKKASVISAVDLIKGIGILANMDSIDVEGATGNIDTNFSGKAQAAIEEFKKGQDFVYIHIEAPDESGHRHEIDNKVKSIEEISEKIVKPLLDYLNNCGEDFAILVTPDHATPISLMTHTNDPVPFIIYRSADLKDYPDRIYSEDCAKETQIFIKEGHTLIRHFFGE